MDFWQSFWNDMMPFVVSIACFAWIWDRYKKNKDKKDKDKEDKK